MSRILLSNAGVALSVAGSSHLRDGRGCDDACALRFRKGVVHAVLADGAGSAPRSSEGARLAVLVASHWLEKSHLSAADSHPDEQLRRCFESVHKRLANLAEGRGHAIEDYATTLSVAVVRPKLAMAMHVGDGAMVVRECSGEYQTLCREVKTGPANVADFITDRNYIDHLRFTRLTGAFDALAGMTDGLEPLAFTPDRLPYGRFFTPLLDRLGREGPGPTKRLLQEFLASDRVRAASDDDLSLVMALMEVSR